MKRILYILILCTLLGGCYRHRQNVANSAASIVELSLALEHRPGLAPVLVPPIRRAATVIIEAQGRTYTPSMPPPQER